MIPSWLHSESLPVRTSEREPISKNTRKKRAEGKCHSSDPCPCAGWPRRTCDFSCPTAWRTPLGEAHGDHLQRLLLTGARTAVLGWCLSLLHPKHSCLFQESIEASCACAPPSLAPHSPEGATLKCSCADSLLQSGAWEPEFWPAA